MFEYKKEELIMQLSNNETRLLIHRDILASAKGKEALQDYFHDNPNIPNHTIFKSITESGELVTQDAPLAQQTCTLTECSFGHFISQSAMDGYMYASLRSFIQLVGYPSI